jgi:filamentous hemagglutinin family protein
MRAGIALLAMASSSYAAAQSPASTVISTDASLGTTVSQSGPIYQINGGTPVDQNLFHSFSDFILATGDTARFADPVGYQNILSRVTGMNASEIYGTIENIDSSANLWLINPNGVVFGDTSSLNVMGSFHASTADFLEFADGGRFYADMSVPGGAGLYVGSPTTFGFLDIVRPCDTLGTCNVSISNTSLSVMPGQDMSFVGDEVGVDSSTLVAPGGQANLVSVGSISSPNGEGLVTLLPDAISISGISYAGDEYVSMSNESTLDVNGDGGGSIYIRGGQFSMGNNETLKANTEGASHGGIIDIQVIGQATFHGVVEANTVGSGSGGDIFISAGSITTADRNNGVSGETYLEARAESSGHAGSITLNAASIVDLNGPVRVSTMESGNAGNISITGTSLNLNSTGEITSSTQGEGAGGNINITLSGDLNIGSGKITAETTGSNMGGAGGDITITANSVSNSQFIEISTTTRGDGAGGDILLEAATSIRLNTGSIRASAESSGDGGSVTLRADTITLEDHASLPPVAVLSETSGNGSAGDIFIEGNQVDIHSGAKVNASTSGEGSAGSVSISATDWFEISSGSSVASRSTQADSGSAGSVAVSAGDVLISTGGLLTVQTNSDNISNSPGSVEITGDRTITVRTGDLVYAAISASTAGADNGGDVMLTAPLVHIDASLIEASTDATGIAGNITINASGLLDISNGALINSTSTGPTSGAAGSITVNSGNTQITGNSLLSVSTESDETANAVGSIDINATDSILIDNGGFSNVAISATTSGASDGGSVSVAAPMVSIGNSTIGVSTVGSGAGGNVTFNVLDQLLLTGDGHITATTQGAGAGGNVDLNADIIRITGNAEVSVATSGTGRGGTATLSARDFTLDGQAIVSADTLANGAGGNIQVIADDATVAGDGRIVARTFGDGDGGIVTIEADNVYVVDGGTIAANSFGSGGGGNVNISGAALTVENGGTLIGSASGSGTGGSITLTPDNLYIGPGGSVSVSATGSGSAGSILIDAGEAVYMENGRIAASGSGSSGGSIVVNAADLVLMEDSHLVTNASGSTGDAGTIQIGQGSTPNSPTILIIQGNTIEAIIDGVSSGTDGAININGEYILGADNTILGNVDFDVPATDFVSVIAQLDLPILNVADLLGDRCAVSAMTDRSSFIVDTAGLPPSPDSPLSSSYFLYSDTFKISSVPKYVPGNSQLPVVFRRRGC